MAIETWGQRSTLAHSGFIRLAVGLADAWPLKRLYSSLFLEKVRTARSGLGRCVAIEMRTGVTTAGCGRGFRPRQGSHSISRWLSVAPPPEPRNCSTYHHRLRNDLTHHHRLRNDLNHCHRAATTRSLSVGLMVMAVGRRDAGNGWCRRQDAGGGATLNHRLIEYDPCRGRKLKPNAVECPSTPEPRIAPRITLISTTTPTIAIGPQRQDHCLWV